MKEVRELEATNEPAYCSLTRLARSWVQVVLDQQGRVRDHDLSTKKIVSPYEKGVWYPQEETAADIPQVGGLKLATFGWWEIQTPTKTTTKNSRTS